MIAFQSSDFNDLARGGHAWFRACMRRIRHGAAVTVLASMPASEGTAGPVCPDSSYVQVTYACTFTGSYRTHEPLDVVTVAPNRNGETFAENGISIRVFLKDCQGNPVAGVPAESITLTHPELCVCPGGNIADAPTDAVGSTTFSGPLRGGGCVPNLILQVDGIDVCTVPVMTNTPDFTFGAPCYVNEDELSYFAFLISGRHYTICQDLNEDGIIDVLDWSILVNRYYGSFGSSCESPVEKGSR